MGEVCIDYKHKRFNQGTLRIKQGHSSNQTVRIRLLDLGFKKWSKEGACTNEFQHGFILSHDITHGKIRTELYLCTSIYIKFVLEPYFLASKLAKLIQMITRELILKYWQTKVLTTGYQIVMHQLKRNWIFSFDRYNWIHTIHVIVIQW